MENRPAEKPRFSVIVPVYNRIDEVRDLLGSLSAQTLKNFEVVIVEDGSTAPCEEAVREVRDVDVSYYYKENEGRSIARNYGLERARGDYFIFFDSDCVIPPDYFATLTQELDAHPTDCFGGPDSAHESFSSTQKAINFAMTSFLTTGGIRGGKVSLEKFVPRTFNMGFARKVYEKVGGFREMFSEDIDMSTRIREAGFSIALVRPAYVYHKRRIDLKKFLRQVYVFGMSRITLKLLYPGSLKAVHALPAIAVLIGLALVVLAITVSPWFLLPLAIYLAAIFIAALISTRSIVIAAKAVPASVIQICGYGCGFIKAYVIKILLGKGRDVEEEIMMRKGK
ncbi:MAG: glycosyltransferase [Duncaniella sp.]|uniref:glycosyltransferase n=1 Tax=Duncaniella sp. TaxID=2518496 RepID=UPI0019AB20C1|nr:glycosyltransferase [Duncaniella sp.]MBD5335282.1 glycosyltransferase [Bacteroides sp.]MDE6089955.1 glycosyltransferase [Duncaniella sp.]